mgnify:CR=1 FL=1
MFERLSSEKRVAVPVHATRASRPQCPESEKRRTEIPPALALAGGPSRRRLGALRRRRHAPRGNLHMKTVQIVLLAAGFASASPTFAAVARTANPQANLRTQAVLDYLIGLESRTDKRLVSGQFVNFGTGANLKLMCWNARWSLAQNHHAKELLDHPWSVNRGDLPKGLAGNP